MLEVQIFKLLFDNHCVDFAVLSTRIKPCLFRMTFMNECYFANRETWIVLFHLSYWFSAIDGLQTTCGLENAVGMVRLDG